MAFDEAWNETDPPGTELAKNIDDHIRKVRRQLTDRFEDHIVEAMAADPWVLRPEVSGLKESKRLLIPAAAFVGGDPADIIYAYQHVRASGENFIAPIILPVGVTIQQVELMANAPLAFEWHITSRTFAATGANDDFTNLLTTAHSVAGAIAISATAVDLGIVTDADTLFNIQVDAIGSFGQPGHIFGARITYDTPSHLNTI